MVKNEIGKLVRIAKGDDRSLREYAKDSGVDAAIISKIINGTYIPRKTDIYMKLTDSKAAPRGGVSCEQLVKAANSSKSYQDGIKAAMMATTAAFTVIGNSVPAGIAVAGTALASTMLDIANKTSGKTEKAKNSISPEAEQLLEYGKQQIKFRTTALGVIVTSMARQGITCKVEDISELNFTGAQPEECLTIIDQPITSWWLIFSSRNVYIDELLSHLLSDQAKSLISKLASASSDPMRKASIVVDDSALYGELVSYKEKTSYRGELSVILVDINRFEVIKEEYVAHYYEKDSTREMKIV